MDQSLIHDARRKLRRRQLLSRLGWPLPKAAHPSRLRQREFRVLLRRGRVVWAAVAQANQALFDPGESDLPGNIIFSPDAAFDENLGALAQIATRIYRLKTAMLYDLDIGQQAVALTIRDEFNLAENQLLPASLTGGYEVYFSSLQFLRSLLPGGRLQQEWFPLVICPQRSPLQLQLPPTLWPRRLRTCWIQQTPAPEFQPLPPGHCPAGPDLAYPHQRAWEQIIADRQASLARPESGIELTAAAARVLLEVAQQQGVPAMFKVTRTAAGHTFALAESFDPSSEVRVESRGASVIVDKSQWEQVSGTLIDYKESSQERGFTFLTR